MSQSTFEKQEIDTLALYQACCSSDPLVQAEAYETLWHYLYRVSFQLVHDQPEAEALAQDCAQEALERVHNRIAECRAPAAFRAWSRRIAQNITLDKLRRRKRMIFMEDEEWRAMPSGETTTVEDTDLFALIAIAPISERSRRVVLGRYQHDLTDEELAAEECRLLGREVRPSHIQVTRSKDIAKLRDWEPLQLLQPE